MPALPLPGEMMPGQFGPISRVAGPRLEKRHRRCSMSTTGMPSVMQTTSAMPASAASMMASAANGGGTKITDALAPVSLHRVGDRVEDRPALVRRAALAGRHAADDRGVVRRRGLGVERAFAAGQALHEQTRVLVEEHRH